MMRIELAGDTVDEICYAIARLVDGPSRRDVKAGYLILYESETARGDPIATMSLSRPAFGPVKNGAMTANRIEDGFATREGEIRWAEICDANKKVVFGCDVGEKDATIKINAIEIKMNAPVIVNSLTIRMPKRKISN